MTKPCLCVGGPADGKWMVVVPEQTAVDVVEFEPPSLAEAFDEPIVPTPVKTHRYNRIELLCDPSTCGLRNEALIHESMAPADIDAWVKKVDILARVLLILFHQTKPARGQWPSRN